MHNRGQLVFGVILLTLGVLFLIGAVFQINIWEICWPLGFIVVGVWLVARPNLISREKGIEVVLLGELQRRGLWTLRNEEIWLGVGDVNLDLTQAVIPEGETKLNLYGFVGDVDMLIPKTVGAAIRLNGVIIDSELLGHEMDAFLAPVEQTSANYATAPQKVMIEMWGFVVDIKVLHI